MTDQLWGQNTPAGFWKILGDVSQEDWDICINQSKYHLGPTFEKIQNHKIPEMILGEGQFGKNHFELSLAKKCYYLVKPIIPRMLSRQMRKIYRQPCEELEWPIEDRLVRFLWDVPKQLLKEETHGNPLHFIHFWPNAKRFSFILTHDVESEEGLKHIRKVMDIEEHYGFRSSFNIIPERYKVDRSLLDEICQRGFEIGIHGLFHDGKLFNSKYKFSERAKKINQYIKKYNAKGFRSPLMQRNPEWMQCLDIEYDLSFFDTDPFEAIPGGTMSIYPFQMGKFIELPYTLVQDFSLNQILCQNTPKLWLDKVDFIRQFFGMVLVNVHPDYLILNNNWQIYQEFLRNMKEKEDCWHALPCEAALWWKNRNQAASVDELTEARLGTLTLENNQLLINSQ